MKIIKVGLGNTDEAYIESKLSDGINIIFSDENNKGKTIVIQSLLYAIGNKPIFPSSFNYKFPGPSWSKPSSYVQLGSPS